MVVILAMLLVLFLVGGVFLLTAGLWAVAERNRVAERLRDLSPPGETRRATGRHRRIYLRWLYRLGRPLVGNQTERRELAELLNAAGFPGGEAVTLYALLRMAAALMAGASAGLFMLDPAITALELAAYAALAFIIVFVGLKYVLSAYATSRQAKVRREMAFVLDLMVLVLESGVSLDQCLRHSAQSSAKVAPVVNRGLNVLIHDIGKGTPYETAIERWGERLGVSEGRELAGLFRQSLLYGAELGPSLRGFIDEFANRRLAMARESVGRKAVQLTVVTVVFLLPPLMALIGGPPFTALFNALEQYSP